MEKKLNSIFSLVICAVVVLGVAAQVSAAELSEFASEVVKMSAAENGQEEEAFKNAIADLSDQEVTNLLSELCSKMSPAAATPVVESVIRVASWNRTAENLPKFSSIVMRTVTEASKGNTMLVRAAMRGLVRATLTHPGLKEDGMAQQVAEEVGKQGAQTAVKTATDNNYNVEAVASAVTRGGADGAGSGKGAVGNKRRIAKAMAEGGIEAAPEDQRDTVDHAMMLANALLEGPANPPEPEEASETLPSESE